MMGWLAAGFDHSAGSASFFSMSESSLRMRAGSKILPQVANLIADGSVSEFEIVQGRHLQFLLIVAASAFAVSHPCDRNKPQGWGTET
jgi:hypothetical protein